MFSQSKYHQDEERYPFRTLASNEFGLVIIIHPCFASIVRLNLSSHLKLSPPSFLIHSLCQVIHLDLIFLQFWLSPHQNLATIQSISLHNLLGNLKHAMVYRDCTCHIFNQSFFPTIYMKAVFLSIQSH